MKNSGTRFVELIWAALMIAVISSTATLLLTGRSSKVGDMRWVTQEQYETIERYGRLDEIRRTLEKEYYKPLDEDALLLGAMRGMTASVGDIYTFYYTPEELTRENQDSEGKYHGIGLLVEMNANDQLEVLRVYPHSPAEDAGIQAGDLIIAVDGRIIGGSDGTPYTDAIKQIRGEENTEVVLTVMRDNQSMKLSILRADVQVDYASHQMLDNSIGYVSISQFSGNAADRFEEALEDFRSQGARGMIIDVRNNPGGLLNVVNRIADSILPEGIIVYIQDREGRRTDYYSDEACCDIPLVVLCNDMSASAAEILCASVQALNRGKVVGLTTYGKGIVQTLIRFEEDGAGMQLTTSSYYDANGRSIHGVGVTPDVEVALDGDRVPLNPDPVSDNQLRRAIEVLEESITEESRAQDAA